MPLGTQTGGDPLDPARRVHTQEPRVRCFGSGASDQGGNRAPWNRDQGCFSPLAPEPARAGTAKGTPLGTRVHTHVVRGKVASGSDKRQRGETVTVRLTKDERDTLDALSSRSGMAAGAFMRAAAFGDAGPRAQRRPPVDHVALRQLLGECGRVGNNLNQIAHNLNAGRPVNVPELRAALAAYLDIRAAILRALAMDTTGEDTPP